MLFPKPVEWTEWTNAYKACPAVHWSKSVKMISVNFTDKNDR